jgi:hypothetical protein
VEEPGVITVKEEFVGGAKWRRAIKLGGAETILMWLALKRYAAEHPLDGFIADDEIDGLPGAPKNPRKALGVLVECGHTEEDGSRGAGLVDAAPNGWRLHDYEDHASSSTEEQLRREKARERKRRWREEQERLLVEIQAGQKAGPSRGTGRDRKRDRPAGQDGTNDGTDSGTEAGPPAQAGAPPREPARAPVPSPTQPEEILTAASDQGSGTSEPVSGVHLAAAAAPADPYQRISCPPDLDLLRAQHKSLELAPGIPEWHRGQMVAKFRASWLGDTTLTMTIGDWRKRLSAAISRDWSDVTKRPKKPNDPAADDFLKAEDGWAV